MGVDCYPSHIYNCKCNYYIQKLFRVDKTMSNWDAIEESKDEESRLFSVTYLPTVPTVEAATIFINELVESFRMPEYSETAEVIASSLSPLPKIK